jgi:hypothetical protein
MKPELEKPVREATGTARKGKKPYVKPACVSEEIFETTALACGKQPGRGGACIGAPRLS